jgi:hydroxypyruvate reductase
LDSDPRRALLLDLFRQAVGAVEGRRRVRAALAGAKLAEPVSAFAVGKAAASMMLGARDALGTVLARGLVVTPEGAITSELRDLAGMQCLEAGHPRPDARSLSAGDALLEFAAATPAGGTALLLVSGGASALIEVPVAGVGLAELAALYDRSLVEGFDIERLNRERRALSRIKGGGLVRLFAQARIEALAISDVPRDDPAVLASGMLAGPGIVPRVVGSLDDALDAAVRGAAMRGLQVLRSATSSRSAASTCSPAAARPSSACPSMPGAAVDASTWRWRRPARSRATKRTCCSPQAPTGATEPARMPARWWMARPASGPGMPAWTRARRSRRRTPGVCWKRRAT